MNVEGYRRKAALTRKRGQAIVRQHRTNHHGGTLQGLTAITAVTLRDRRQGSDFASAFRALQT